MKRLLLSFVFLTFKFGVSNAQNQTVDSLRLLLKKAKHDTTKLQLRNDIGLASEILRIGYWDSIYKDAKKLNLKVIESDALNNIGFIYDTQGKVPQALEYYEKCKQIKENIGDNEGIASSLNNIAIIFKDQGNIQKALEYLERSLKIREEIHDTLGVAISLGNLGNIYQGQGDNKNALKYFERSLKISQEIGDKESIAFSLNNLGMLYNIQHDSLKALAFYSQSLKLHEETGSQIGISTLLNNIGHIHYSQHNYSEALNYYRRSLKIFKEIDSREGIANTMNNIANAFFGQKKYKDASSYSDSALIIAKELSFPRLLINAEASRSDIDSAMGNSFGALEHYKKFIVYRDSINNEETRKASIRNQFKYEYDKKEVIINEQLKQKEKEKNYFIIGLALLAVLAVFIFRSYRLKQKANTIITEQKRLVEEHQKEMVDSITYAKRIQKANLPTEKYIDKNLRRLKDKL